MTILSHRTVPTLKAATIAGLALAFPGALPSADAAKETPQTFSADYHVSFLGFTVAKSRFTSTITSGGFEMAGDISSAGLGAFFDDTRGTTVSSGRFAKGQPRPDAYSVSYTYGKKSKRTALQFAKGNITKVENVPALPERNADWVAVDEASLRGVIDPISSALVKADNLASACGRTIRIFDGEILADIGLEPAKVTRVDLPAYKGPAAVCRARFMPVAGYNSGNKSIKYLRDRSKITITFAELGQTGVYAPIHATVGTKVGTVTIAAHNIRPQ